MNTMSSIFFNVQLVLPDRVVPGSVLVENGIIAAVETTDKMNSSFPPSWKANKASPPELIDGEGKFLSPGFIDIHNHGRLFCDYMDRKDTSMETIARNQAEHGVTGFLAGTSSISWEKSLKALSFLADYYKKENKHEEAAKGAQYLGIYSEGSFFSLEKRGAHNPDFLKTSLEKEDLDALFAAAGSALKVVALSPELKGAEQWIQFIRNKGIVVAAAHTNADYHEAMAGIEAGITLATHTFNGMKSLSHQEPGILGAVLNDNRVYCELIADCIHLDPVILSLVYKLKGPDRIILISDSVLANGVPDGNYEYEGRKVTIRDGAVRLEDGRLAGSTLSLDKAVYNMVKYAGIELMHAVKAASLNPAGIIGLEHKKGSIEPGKDADLVIFNEDIKINKVFIGGFPLKKE